MALVGHVASSLRPQVSVLTADTLVEVTVLYNEPVRLLIFRKKDS